jgi:hypothetical protein
MKGSARSGCCCLLACLLLLEFIDGGPGAKKEERQFQSTIPRRLRNLKMTLLG